jgi:hypothetical protein
MKVIICPYYWDCGKTYTAKALDKSDVDFLQSAILKKMTFMFLNCPNCSRMFKFNPVAWEAEASHALAPDIPVNKKQKTTKQLTAILKKEKVEIPLAYLDYLTGNNFHSEISLLADREHFKLYNLSELCENINIDDHSYLTIKQLKGFAKALITISEETPLKQAFTIKDLSNCLAIGHENTSVLFLDKRDNNTLWIFHPDGWDIEKTNLTLKKIIAG